MTKQANRTEKLDIRLTPKAKRTLQAAAIAERRKVSEFVLESALARAPEETLANRQRFSLDAERWTAFLEALDAPPRDLPRVRRLFEEPPLRERLGLGCKRSGGRCRKQMTDFRIEKIAPHHAVEGFDCGTEALNRYLIRFALVNQRASTGQTYWDWRMTR